MYLLDTILFKYWVPQNLGKFVFSWSHYGVKENDTLSNCQFIWK